MSQPSDDAAIQIGGEGGVIDWMIFAAAVFMFGLMAHSVLCGDADGRLQRRRVKAMRERADANAERERAGGEG